MKIVLYREWLCTDCGCTWPWLGAGKPKPRFCYECSKREVLKDAEAAVVVAVANPTRRVKEVSK